MASLTNLSIDLNKVQKDKVKDGRWLNITIALNDEVDQFGNNASCFHYQTKEQRDNGVAKVYVGNGKVVWENGTIVKAPYIERVNNTSQNANREETDLF